MLKVVAKMRVKEDKIETVIETCRKLVAATRQEEGNIGYTFNVSVDDPCLFAMIENWKDKESLDAHMKQPHFIEAMAVVSECTEGDTTIELFTEV